MYPQIEFDRKESVQKIQLKHFKEILERVYKKSKFYKEKFDDLKIKPEDIHSLNDIKKLPFTTKDDIKSRNLDFLCVEMKEVYDIVASSGTTGDPIFIMMTCKDVERLALNEKYSFLCAGTTKEDIFQLLVTLDGMFIAGNAFYRGIGLSGAKVMRMGPGNAKRQLMVLEKMKPTGFVGVPSFLITLANEALKEGINPKEFGVKKAVLVAESMRNQDFSPNELAKKITYLWGLELFSTYGCTEMQTSFCECKYHQGGHSHPDLIIVEIVNEHGNVLPPGELGEVVVTTLQVEGMPLIRFKTGDVSFIIDEICKCGRTSPRIGPVIGRKNHLLKIKGTNVYPGHIENALISIPSIKNYFIEAYIDENFSDAITIKVDSDNPSEELAIRIKENVKAYARMTPNVEFIGKEDILKLQFPAEMRKPIKFKDLR